MNGTKNKKKKGITGIIRVKWWQCGLAGLILGIGMVAYFFRDVPSPKTLSEGNYAESSQLFDRNGKLIYEIYADKRRTSVSIDEIPKYLKEATLAIEDANFYKHGGFDIKGILRGLWRTIVEKRLQGGSTLTQQLVKNGLLTPERTWKRKIKEAVLTIMTEARYSKEQILEMYFNQTPYGGTLWGVEAAAKGIFNKRTKDLDLAESALIAGLPGSPTRYSPFAHPDSAKARQELVLKRMKELGYINEEEMVKASQEVLNYYLNKNEIQAPHFAFYIKELLTEKYGSKMVNEGGLRITTSLDLDLQNYVQEIVATEMAKLKKMNVTNGAVLITEAKTGQILAMVGSKDYFAEDIEGKFNITTASRQPGSAIKPLNYAVGLETGKVTAASIFIDEPTCFNVTGQKSYCPSNYGGAYHGIQTLRNSLGNSLNIPAVKMLKINGLETFVASAAAMGISTYKDPSAYGLSLTLGGGEVMMTDMNVAFGALANTGLKQKLEPIIKVVDRHGKTLEEFSYVPGERVLSRETSFIISNILSDDGARSMVFGNGSLLNIKGHPEVAVKTGTTNDLRDNWTIGYTPDYVVSVWVGNNNNSKMSGVVSGTTGAAPIWNKVMNQILKDKPVKKPLVPASVVKMAVCNLTGQLVPDEGCDSHYEYFIKDSVPTNKVSVSKNLLINKDNNTVVGEGETPTNVEWQTHPAVEDVSGAWWCLDCGVTSVTEIN